jgi:hypothetical protein
MSIAPESVMVTAHVHVPGALPAAGQGREPELPSSQRHACIPTLHVPASGADAAPPLPPAPVDPPAPPDIAAFAPPLPAFGFGDSSPSPPEPLHASPISIHALTQMAATFPRIAQQLITCARDQGLHSRWPVLAPAFSEQKLFGQSSSAGGGIAPKL